MISRETGKDRAARIPYNYQHGRDRFIGTRIALTAVALVAALGWWVWGMVDSREGRLRASHGPLARVHAAWDAKCEACHLPLSKTGAIGVDLTPGLASAAGDAKCQTCHMGPAEEAHHPVKEGVAGTHCVSCHSDHLGRNATLVRRDEAQCTSCHKDLDAVMASSPSLPGIAKSITHFAGDSHPAFRSAAEDPGRLKFNHALHMTKGLKLGKDSVDLFTFAQLPEADRERYGWASGKKLGDPVALDCASCHQADAPPGTSPSDRGPGAYMAPIAYANQCAACHPIEVPGAQARGALLAVRHGLQPEALGEELRARYVGLKLTQDPKLLDELKPMRFPGQREREESAREEVGRHVAAAEKVLFGSGKGTCTECHEYSTKDGGPVTGDDGRVDVKAFHVLLPDVPTTWFGHATFDHSAHRAMECRACHNRAYPDDPAASGMPASSPKGSTRLPDGKETWTSNKDVLIPDIKVCQECHAPATHSGRAVRGGASFDCTECHTFHNGSHPREGRGAPARGPKDRMDIDTFLSGIGRGGSQ